MYTALQKIGIRFNAIYLPEAIAFPSKEMTPVSANFIKNIRRLGYVVKEDLLHQLNELPEHTLQAIYEAFAEVLQVKNNWAPLVSNWDKSTEEKGSRLGTFFQFTSGTLLDCGHSIPDKTFPLNSYNGCPFCGMPFILSNEILTGQGSKKKELSLWTNTHVQELYSNLLQSKTALDATQVDTLKTLLQIFDLPAVTITMKETQMLVTDTLVENGKAAIASTLMSSPVDIMRYLWYKHTGFLQIIAPSVLIKRHAKNQRHMLPVLNQSAAMAILSRESLKLKYNRSTSKMIATWLNNLPMSAEAAAELMHPKRGMWVRFIRALRLPEYSHKPGMGPLARLLDVFYNEKYTVYAAQLEQSRLKFDLDKTFALLKQRPGLFARSLFANMVWFGHEITLAQFKEIEGQIPARLLITLASYATNYFDADNDRIVKPLGGTDKLIKANKYLALYDQEQLQLMADEVTNCCLDMLTVRFTKAQNGNKTVFIDPSLYTMPLPVGDRATSVQDLPAALMGTRFPVEGDTVRLFMQWGVGLPQQHLDMDLSCQIIYDDTKQFCSYFQLDAIGAKHSGDIRSIPNKTGTAEYIELDLAQLQKANARYVAFTCNAYSNGAITPNLVLGWMNSQHKMKVNARTGVAYDPSCVQHRVRVTQNLNKGLLFGVLNVAAREIIWLEMAFDGQTTMSLDLQGLERMIAKLNAKISIGTLLDLKVRAQNLVPTNDPNLADESYTAQWAMDTAKVTQLLID
ncbi:hypothetical protein CLV59_108278 [Chitinophaga dinghuensis]|uniref:Prokaryotic RING finger family 4 n=1 Tax=Chitinophaga dinghuensis TaxID=1539050 RepID=A0A327VQV4_9BACT|nr:TerD family protein [Chitinophaga dinghuensis]RAJ76757.1 hypothetical protein CLV59_108278 [Chitinophaga dinghuensis]